MNDLVQGILDIEQSDYKFALSSPARLSVTQPATQHTCFPSRHDSLIKAKIKPEILLLQATLYWG